MKLRRADNVGQIAGVRRVAERDAEERDQREELRAWEQPAATLELERRCPVCRAVCADDAGKECPVNAEHPAEHRAAQQLIARIRSERSRPMAALLTGQLQTVLGRLQAG